MEKRTIITLKGELLEELDRLRGTPTTDGLVWSYQKLIEAALRNYFESRKKERSEIRKKEEQTYVVEHV